MWSGSWRIRKQVDKVHYNQMGQEITQPICGIDVCVTAIYASVGNGSPKFT